MRRRYEGKTESDRPDQLSRRIALNIITRSLAALSVGVTIAAGAGVACATPHSPEGYIADIRDVMPEADGASISDDQLIGTGRMMCAYPESLNTTVAGTDAAPEYVEYTKITATSCDVLGSAPTPGVPSGPTPAAAPQRVGPNERFDVYGGNGVKVADIAFTKIDVDSNCSAASKYGGSGKPERGHFIAVTMDVATTPEYTADAMSYPTAYDFTITGPDGYAETSLDASTAYCVDFDDTFNAPLTAASKYRRTVLLDAKNGTGELSFRPHFNQTWPGVTIPLA